MITISAGPCLLVLALDIAWNKKLTSECSANAGKRQVRTYTQAENRSNPIERRCITSRKKRSHIVRCRPSHVLSAILSRLDQSEVSILSFIKHSYPVRVRVAKDDKAICPVREFQRRFFRGHRLHVIPAGINDSHRQRGRL